MKKFILTGLLSVAVATTSALAGTDYKASKAPVPVEAPCLYRDMEFQVDAFGLGGFYRQGEPVWGGGLGANFFFLRYIGLGVEQFVAGGNDRTDWGTFGNLFVRYPFCWGLSPYAMIGIGKVYAEGREGVGGGTVGGGLEYRFTENIGLFTDARWLYSPDLSNSGGVIARTGVRFAF